MYNGGTDDLFGWSKMDPSFCCLRWRSLRATSCCVLTVENKYRVTVINFESALGNLKIRDNSCFVPKYSFNKENFSKRIFQFLVNKVDFASGLIYIALSFTSLFVYASGLVERTRTN